MYIVDCYNCQIFPQDTEAKDAIQKIIPVKKNITDQEYLALISNIQNDIQYYQPEFVIYNAGTDVLKEDPLGELSLKRETVVLRDEKVMGMCMGRKIPVVMLLSGGYQRSGA